MMNTIQAEDRTYVEVDTIRLVVEDGEIVGWYAPAGLYGHTEEECENTSSQQGHA